MTYEIGDKSKPQIVMVHGFGGSALIFYKLFKRLQKNYHVILIDLLGNGSSSRPEFLARTKDEAEAFYVQSLEKWRKKMGISQMNLVAHSFGAYISSRYAIKYPDRIKKLILWSPHGMEPKPDNYEERLKERMRGSCRFRCFLK